MDKARAYKWSAELVGHSDGGWVIDDLLGKGKSAIVVKARRGDQIGALKLFEPELVERFGREAQLARIERETSLIGKQLPHLITVLGGGEHESLLYVVMEYLPAPWKLLCDCLAEVPRAAIWPLISKIAEAARALEQNGLVHRDIKPENIMVQPDFSDVRLLDLGVMRPIAGSNVTDESSRPFIGTLRYGSPEYLLREEHDTVEGWRAISFYQLGGVLHDLIVRLHHRFLVDILIIIVYLPGNAMQVAKWGNSLAVRLPAAVVEALGLKEGDQIEIQVAGKRSFDVTKAPGARELLASLRKFRGALPATFKFDRLDANERH